MLDPRPLSRLPGRAQASLKPSNGRGAQLRPAQFKLPRNRRLVKMAGRRTLGADTSIADRYHRPAPGRTKFRCLNARRRAPDLGLRIEHKARGGERDAVRNAGFRMMETRHPVETRRPGRQWRLAAYDKRQSSGRRPIQRRSGYSPVSAPNRATAPSRRQVSRRLLRSIPGRRGRTPEQARPSRRRDRSRLSQAAGRQPPPRPNSQRPKRR